MSGSRRAERPPSPLPRKLFAGFVAFCAVPLFVLCAASYLLAARAVHEMLERESQRALVAWRTEIGRLLDRVRADAAILAREGAAPDQPLGRLLDGAPVDDDLLTLPFVFLEQRILFRSLVLTGADGRPRARLFAPGLASGPPGMTRMTRVERHALGAADTLGFAVATRLRQPHAILRAGPGVPTIRVLAAVRTPPDSALSGILAADVPVADLVDQAARASGGSDSTSAILRFALDAATGAFLAHDQIESVGLPAAVVEPELASRALSGTPRAGDYRAASGERRFLVVVPEPQLGVVLGASAASGRLLAPFRRAAALVALATLALVAATAVLLALFSRAFRTSLQRLLDASTAFARGDLGHRAALPPGDDLEVLGAALDRMAGDLARSTAERERAARFESISRVAALVAHDLKGMAFDLSMLAENLEAQPAAPPSTRRAVASLAALARRMKGTLARLPQAGRTPPPLAQRVDLAALAADVLQESGAGHAPGVELHTALGGPAWIDGDADGLRRSIANLVWNALDAMPRGGRLAVRVEAGPAGASLRVADTGCGMSPEFLRTRLFQPFATTKPRGLGLGLTGVRETVEAHGGRIEVESVEGTGTTFTVTLPAAAPRDRSEQA